jgi:YD repeat-containing protein
VVEPVSSTHSITTTFGWDAAGNSTRLTDGKGNATWTTYNTWNLPESTIEPATTAHPAAADRTWTTTYEAGGLPVREDHPGGVVVTRSFDELGRLTAESGTGGGAPAASRSFGWDKGGRRTSMSHPTGTVSFAYDERGLMTSATGGAGSSSFAWDAAGRMTSRTDAAGTATFTWTDRDELATATDPLTGVTRTYGRDDAGQMTSVSHGAGAASRTLAWDDLGRLASDTLAAPGGGVRAATVGSPAEGRG